MPLHRDRQIDVKGDVSVDGQQGPVAESIARLPQSAADAENLRFAVDHRCRPVGQGPAKGNGLIGQMMAVQANFLDPRFNEMIGQQADQGLVADRQQRLGSAVGQGAEPGPETGRQNEGLIDSKAVHGHSL